MVLRQHPDVRLIDNLRVFAGHRIHGYASLRHTASADGLLRGLGQSDFARVRLVPVLPLRLDVT